MRQIADLAVWVGMIGVAVGVIRYAPVVAEYVTAESRPRIESATIAPGSGTSPPAHPSPRLAAERYAVR